MLGRAVKQSKRCPPGITPFGAHCKAETVLKLTIFDLKNGQQRVYLKKEGNQFEINSLTLVFITNIQIQI